MLTTPEVSVLEQQNNSSMLITQELDAQKWKSVVCVSAVADPGGFVGFVRTTQPAAYGLSLH